MEPVRQANLSPRIWKAKNTFLERSLMGNICCDDDDCDGGGDFMIMVMLVSSNGDDDFDDVVSENLKG